MRRVLMVLMALTTTGILTTSGASPADAAGLPLCDGVTWNSWSTPTGLFAETLVPSRGNDTWNWQCNLQQGAGEGLSYCHGTRVAVRQLQLTINTCYPQAPNAPLTLDGKYGSRTRAAVEYVQRREGVTVDGQAGPNTRAAMDWRYYEYQFDQIVCLYPYL